MKRRNLKISDAQLTEINATVGNKLKSQLTKPEAEQLLPVLSGIIKTSTDADERSVKLANNLVRAASAYIQHQESLGLDDENIRRGLWQMFDANTGAIDAPGFEDPDNPCRDESPCGQATLDPLESEFNRPRAN